MKPGTTTVRVGDWVHSDSPGIWRVYRMIENVQRMRFDLRSRRRVDRDRFVFSKRFLDESGKPAFAGEMANAEFVCPLSEGDKRRLEEFIAENPRVFEEFEAFEPDGVDIAMDLPLNVPASVGKEGLQKVIDDVFSDMGERALTNNEVLHRLADTELSRYATETIRNATLRFLCKGHEILDNEYVFRRVQLIMV